jgi:hypothetical protein
VVCFYSKLIKILEYMHEGLLCLLLLHKYTQEHIRSELATFLYACSLIYCALMQTSRVCEEMLSKRKLMLSYNVVKFCKLAC